MSSVLMDVISTVWNVGICVLVGRLTLAPVGKEARVLMHITTVHGVAMVESVRWMRKVTPIPLNTPCNGKCNTGRSFYGGRQYWTCDNKEQCIKIQHWADKIHHCMDRSDERKRPEDVYSPIQWDQMTTCGNTSDPPGVKCNGWCMPYYHWCNELSVMKCRELGGRTTVHKEVCSNNTFWTRLPCRYYSNVGKWCSSEYSGQCYFTRPQKSSHYPALDPAHQDIFLVWSTTPSPV